MRWGVDGGNRGACDRIAFHDLPPDRVLEGFVEDAACRVDGLGRATGHGHGIQHVLHVRDPDAIQPEAADVGDDVRDDRGAIAGVCCWLSMQRNVRQPAVA